MVLVRMLRNLKRIYLEQEDLTRLSIVLDRLVTLSPETPEEIRDRGIVHYQQEAYRLAKKDFETFLSVAPEAPDSDLIRQYLHILGEYSSRMN
jgi:regulator of sirC expression with transglutaminase-like and TPR domain